MWDHDSLVGKAQVYFKRAADHPHADDEVWALWLLLGLEFLLRAPVAKVSPILLADPQNGENLLHAAGYPNPKPEASAPKSVGTATVISRLGRLIPTFTQDLANDANILIGLRNAELHTGAAALSEPSDRWLPRFMRVVEILATDLGYDAKELLGDEIASHGRSLVDVDDKKVRSEVLRRIAEAKAFVAKLDENELTARRAAFPSIDLQVGATGFSSGIFGTVGPNTAVPCPACNTSVPPKLQAVRTTNERIEDWEIIRDIVYVLLSLRCHVCGLELTSTAEIKYAGLSQEVVRSEVESVGERYANGYEPDYGND